MTKKKKEYNEEILLQEIKQGREECLTKITEKTLYKQSNTNLFYEYGFSDHHKRREIGFVILYLK